MAHRDDTLQVSEIRRILQLIRDLHALPAPGVGRRRRMLQGLCDLLDADAAESTILEPAPHTSNGDFTLSSSIVVSPRRRPTSLLRKSRNPCLIDPALPHLLTVARTAGPAAVITRTRRQLVPDRDWHQSDFVRQVRRPAVHDDAIYSARRIVPGSPRLAVLCLARAAGNRRPMGKREARIAHLLHSEAAWVYDTPAPPPSISAGHLTPRQRECLQHLLNGHSEKQIASDLRLSRHTVHVHVKAVYREFSVSTRAELMARLLTPGQARPT